MDIVIPVFVLIFENEFLNLGCGKLIMPEP